MAKGFAAEHRSIWMPSHLTTTWARLSNYLLKIVSKAAPKMVNQGKVGQVTQRTDPRLRYLAEALDISMDLET